MKNFRRFNADNGRSLNCDIRPELPPGWFDHPDVAAKIGQTSSLLFVYRSNDHKANSIVIMLYHRQSMEAESHAQAAGIRIWNPSTNVGGDKRDYSTLVQWWNFRDGVVQDYRLFGIQAGALSVRTDYDAIVEAAKAGNQLTVLCDLQSGINAWTGSGTLIYAGSIFQKFNLWIPNRDSAEAQTVLKLIENRYGGQGRNYVYVSGEASMYPSNLQGKPQIVITDVEQLKDFSPS